MLFRALGVSSVSNPSRSLKDVGAIVVAPLIIRVVAMLVLYRFDFRPLLPVQWF